MAKPPVTIAHVLEKMTVKDTLMSLAIVVLSYHAVVARSTLKATAHEHSSSEYNGNPGSSTAMGSPIGFTGRDFEG